MLDVSLHQSLLISFGSWSIFLRTDISGIASNCGFFHIPIYTLFEKMIHSLKNARQLMVKGEIFMETMIGLVSYPNGDLRLEQVPIPKLGENPYAPNDVLIEVLTAEYAVVIFIVGMRIRQA